MEFDWTVVVSAIMTVLAAVAGVFWKKGKGKIAKVATLARETADLISKATAVLDDDKVTREEVASLKKELCDVKDAWKALVGKTPE